LRMLRIDLRRLSSARALAMILLNKANRHRVAIPLA